jgi:exonuclease SbcD
VAGSFRFIHAADLHLDTPFQGIAGPAPTVALALQEASLQAWDNLVSLTLEREAALLVIAGDIYDGAQRGVRAQLRFLDGLKRLSVAGVQTLIVHGNHDPLDGWTAIRQWPSGVTVFGSDAVESMSVKVGRQTVHVHGISYRTRDVCDNLAKGFKRSRGKSLNIGLLHTNATGEAEHALYCPCTLSDLDAARMDYWALGHIHKQQFLREGGPWVAYSGDTQGRSPKPSESGPKGVLVVDVADAAVGSVTFEPVDAVRFVACSLDIHEIADVPALQAAIIGAVDDLRGQNDTRALIVRVVLEGRGPVAADLRRGGILAEICGELRGNLDGLDPFVWLESIKDRSRGDLDLDVLRSREDFAAELLRLADGLAGDAESADAFIRGAGELLDKPGQVEKELREIDPDTVDDVLAEALEFALDRLEREVDQ